jgi:flagellar P-ring protein FlgI
MKIPTLVLLLVLAAVGAGQGQPGTQTTQDAARQAEAQRQAFERWQRDEQARQEQIRRAELEGVEVRVKDIARFRGVRSNRLVGFGLVVGLEGTGDTKKTPFTQTLISNLMRDFGTRFDESQLQARNVAAVSITAELPAFAKPGTQIDVIVQSIGDARSLQGGVLLPTPLYPGSNREIAYLVAAGPISIGGFNVSSGGSSVQKNHVNVGRIPGGGTVEAAVPTKLSFDGRMYIEMHNADLTTAQRIAEAINQQHPHYMASALDGATVAVSLPPLKSEVEAMSELEMVRLFADVPAVVVINERTGTIVVGANVRIGPAMIAHGGLSVRIDREPIISQPAPFSQGATVVTGVSNIQADESPTQIALITPNATVGDLAKIFQALKLKATDINIILQMLQAQGALKARIELK